MLPDKHLEDYEFYLTPKNVPSGWDVVTLSDVSSKITDGTHKTPKYQKSGVRFISIKNIKPYRPVNWLSYEKYITEEEHAELTKRCKPEYDDILFPRIGTLGYAKRVDFTEEVSLFVGLGLIKPIHEAVLPRYLEHYMNSGYIDRLSRKKANGSGRLTLPLAQTKQFPIPIAPVQEQERIVEKIETLFARLDKGEEAVRDVQKLLTRYRQSVLKSAVTGQLTADWRAERKGQLEHGRDLLTRVLNKRRKQWSGRGKYKEPAVPDTIGKSDLPDGWTWSTIEQLGYVLSGQTPKEVESHTKEGGFVPWFKVSSMNDPGNETLMFTSQWMFTEESAKAAKLNIMPKGTIAFPKRGGAILTNKKRQLGVPGALDLNTMGFVPVALERYVWTYFLGLDLRQIYDGSNVPQINYHDIADLFIAVPSEEEAAVICEEAEERLSQISKLEEWCSTELKRSASLRQSILKDAFAGKLVPQDPADEPASVLLARIAAEKPTAKKTRRKAQR